MWGKGGCTVPWVKQPRVLAPQVLNRPVINTGQMPSTGLASYLKDNASRVPLRRERDARGTPQYPKGFVVFVEWGLKEFGCNYYVVILWLEKWMTEWLLPVLYEAEPQENRKKKSVSLSPAAGLSNWGNLKAEKENSSIWECADLPILWICLQKFPHPLTIKQLCAGRLCPLSKSLSRWESVGNHFQNLCQMYTSTLSLFT